MLYGKRRKEELQIVKETRFYQSARLRLCIRKAFVRMYPALGKVVPLNENDCYSHLGDSPGSDFFKEQPSTWANSNLSGYCRRQRCVSLAWL